MSDATPRPPRFLADHVAAEPREAKARFPQVERPRPPQPAAPAPTPLGRRPAPPAAAPKAVEPPAAVAAPVPAAAPARPAGPDPATAQLVERALATLRDQQAGALAAAVQALRHEAQQLAELARADALEIGFLVARRILEAEVAADPKALLGLIRTALKRAGDARAVTVRLHPDDLERVHALGGPSTVAPLSVASLKLLADPQLGVGDCVIDADFGTVDGRLATRLGELKRAAEAGPDGAEEVA